MLIPQMAMTKITAIAPTLLPTPMAIRLSGDVDGISVDDGEEDVLVVVVVVVALFMMVVAVVSLPACMHVSVKQGTLSKQLLHTTLWW